MRIALYSVVFGVTLWILLVAIGIGTYWLAFRS